LERRGPDGRLLGFPLVPLLLVGALRPEGMPHRFRGPLHEGLAEELRTLEAPVPPRLLPTTCGDRGHPCIFLSCSRGGLACAWFAKGDEEAGREDWPSPWEGWEEGAGGRALGTLGDGRVEVRDGLQGNAKLGHQGLHHQGRRGDEALIGGQRRSALDGLHMWRDDVCRAHVVGAAAGRKRGATRELGGLQGRPAAQKVTAKGGVLVRKPWPSLRDIVFYGPGEAVGQAPLLPDHAATMGDERCEGTPSEAWGLERWELVPMRAQECERQGGGGGILWGSAGSAGCPRARYGQRLDREEPQKVIRAQGKDQRPCVECKAESHGLALKPGPPCRAPRVDGFGRVLALEARTLGGASRLETNIMVGIGPVDPNQGRKGVVGRRCHTSSPRVCESGKEGQAR